MTDTHTLRRRPEGRWQCTKCRAAYLAPERARGAVCAGEHLAHAPPGFREHLVEPRDLDRSCAAWSCPDPDPSHAWHGPDPWCDSHTCRRCQHDCTCDACTGTVDAPGLALLEDVADHKQNCTRKKRRQRMADELADQLGKLGPGDSVTARGFDAGGRAVTRTGVLLAQPQEVTARRSGVREKAWRVYVGSLGAPAGRAVLVTLFPGRGTIEPQADEPEISPAAEKRDQDQGQDPSPASSTPPRRRGLLAEGWLGNLEGRGYAVWSLDRTRVLGWLTLDRSRFLRAT